MPPEEATIDRHTNVEMDPTSELEVRTTIKEEGNIIVGWYHSHPTFPPDPSLVDLENQRTYQKLFAQGSEDGEGGIGGPFVGCIVGNVLFSFT